MSIPAPEYNSSLRYNYGGSAVPNDYSGGGYGSNPALQAYQKKLNDWYKNANQIFKSLKNGDQKAIVAQELQQAQEYAQECGFQLGSNWDPMTGNLGAGPDPSNPTGDPTQQGPQQAQYGEMIWQDQSRVKWDGSDPVVYQVSQQGEKRQQDFFQSDVTIQIPYHGAIAKAELVDDDSAAAPAKMLKVTVTMPDGSTRIICVHNVTAKSQIKLQASDTDNIKLDASLTSSPLASQVEVGEISNEEENADNEPKGDPAKERKDKKWGWDGDSFDIYSTNDKKDKHKDKYISARKNVTFHAGSNSEYWTVAWDDTKKEYVVNVYESKEAKDKGDAPTETFHMDDMTNLKATFDIDPTHLEILSPLCDGKDSHKFNTTDLHAKKLSFDQSAEDQDKVEENKILGEEANNVTHSDSSGGKAAITFATYDKNASPTFKNNFDFEGGFYEAIVDASGTVTINPASQSDQFSVSIVGDYVVINVQGKDKDGKDKVLTYKIRKDQVQKISILGISASQIKGLDKLEEKYATKIVDGSGKPITDSNTNASLDSHLDTLRKMSGKSLDQMLVLLKKFYPELDADGDGKVSVAEANKGFTDKVFPPAMPNVNLWKFLYAMDPQFKSAFDSYGPGNGPAIKTATDRLIVLMTDIYPDKNIHWQPGDREQGNYEGWNQFMFGDQLIQYAHEKEALKGFGEENFELKLWTHNADGTWS